MLVQISSGVLLVLHDSALSGSMPCPRCIGSMVVCDVAVGTFYILCALFIFSYLSFLVEAVLIWAHIMRLCVTLGLSFLINFDSL